MSEFDSNDFHRSAQSTRQRIIAAAAAHFARKPLRSVPLKEIARDAGVSAPLIIKYFGSKEGLLVELIDFSPIQGAVKEVEFSDLGYKLADAVLTGHGLQGKSMIPLIVASIDSNETAKIIRHRFDEAFAGDLVRRIHEDAPNNTTFEAAVHRTQMVISPCVGYLLLSATGQISEQRTPHMSVEDLGNCLQLILEQG